MGWVIDADDVPRLARAWDERLRRDMSRFVQLVPEALARGSVLREPATEAQIQDAEQRIGRKLPASYRAFLQVSNGAYASSIGPETQMAWGRAHRHGWLPVDEIVPLVEADEWLVGMWTSFEELVDPENDPRPSGDDGAEVLYFAPLRDALLISRPFDAYKDLLVPRADREEWEFWYLSKEFAVAYRSLAAFLRNQLTRPDLRPKPELADEYAREAEGGNRLQLEYLAELGDSRASEIAFGRLFDPNATESYKSGWANPLRDLADPRFVPSLRRLYEDATMSGFRLELLAALAGCGDPDIDRTLRDVAADSTDDEHLRRWATNTLKSRSADQQP